MHFLALPIEIRIRVFEYVLHDLAVYAEYGPPMERPVRKPGVREKFGHTPDSDDSDGWQLDSPPPPLYRVTKPALFFVSRQVFCEMQKLQWLSRVEFVFPSTVALLDVLLSLPKEQLALIRKVNVNNYPVPLWPVNDEHAYKAHDICEVWTLLGGICLDVLRVNDVYLPASNPTTRAMVLRSMDNMISTQGWKQLAYWSLPIRFNQVQINAFTRQIWRLRTERNEPELEIEFPATNLVQKQDGSFQIKEAEVISKERRAQIVINRGLHADLRQERSFKTKVLEGLFAHMSWKEMRLSGDYLWVEGTSDPDSHF